MRIKLKMDRGLVRFRDRLPKVIEESNEEILKACGMVWSDEAKEVTQQDNHIDTGLYINSIGYLTSLPARKEGPAATGADVINEYEKIPNGGRLTIGSNVAYASILEKRYNIMARGLDNSQGRFNTVTNAILKKNLDLG